MANSKIIYFGEVLIDLTQDTVEANKLLQGVTAHGKDGESVTGSIPSKAAQTYTPTTTAQTIANGQYLSGNQTISGDVNLVPESIKSGTSIFGVVGTFSSDATATAAEILSGATAYVDGEEVIGTMPNRGGAKGTISTKEGTYTIAQGYHDGSGTVAIATAEQAKLIPTNIRQGIQILGVTGTMSGTEGANAQERTVDPSNEDIVVTPGDGYNYLSQVTVKAIKYTSATNEAGGYTITIG